MPRRRIGSRPLPARWGAEHLGDLLDQLEHGAEEPQWSVLNTLVGQVHARRLGVHDKLLDELAG